MISRPVNPPPTEVDSRPAAPREPVYVARALLTDGQALHSSLRQAIEKSESERARRLTTLNLLEDTGLARDAERLEAAKRAIADAALQDSQLRLQLALDVAGMGTFVWEITKRRIRPDEQMTALFGLAGGAPVADDRLLHAIHADDRDRYVGALARATDPQGSGRLRIDVRVIPGDSEIRWLSIAGRVSFDAGSRTALEMIGAAHDVTDSKRLEETLRRALEDTERARGEAEAANRAKDHFLAVLSHELRTPLMPITMATTTLLRRKDLLPPVTNALAMIKRNVELESRLVDDLLEVTKISYGKVEYFRQPMDMHEAMLQAIEICQPDLDAKAQHLTIALDAEQSRVNGDWHRLQQVVWNLLKNASKFTPRDGKVQITTRNETGVLVLAVSDTGIGMEAAALARIFEAFSQADASITRKFGGLGLGLAIAKASVLGHGGQITASSAGTDAGATFTVRLPLA